MTPDPKKVERDGKVAVLISPGFGAGWSTWASEGQKAFALFDPGLVLLAEAGATEEQAGAYIKKSLGEDAYFYTGGWQNIVVEWLPIGTAFQVDEYDGSESLSLRDDEDWTIA